MKKIVTASRWKSACKWVSYVGFVIGVSIFVNDAFIRDVTTLDAGISMVSIPVFLTMSTAQWIADAVDRINTISSAGARDCPRRVPAFRLVGVADRHPDHRRDSYGGLLCCVYGKSVENRCPWVSRRESEGTTEAVRSLPCVR